MDTNLKCRGGWTGTSSAGVVGQGPQVQGWVTRTSSTGLPCKIENTYVTLQKALTYMFSILHGRGVGDTDLKCRGGLGHVGLGHISQGQGALPWCWGTAIWMRGKRLSVTGTRLTGTQGTQLGTRGRRLQCWTSLNTHGVHPEYRAMCAGYKSGYTGYSNRVHTKGTGYTFLMYRYNSERVVGEVKHVKQYLFEISPYWVNSDSEGTSKM